MHISTHPKGTHFVTFWPRRSKELFNALDAKATPLWIVVLGVPVFRVGGAYLGKVCFRLICLLNAFHACRHSDRTLTGFTVQQVCLGSGHSQSLGRMCATSSWQTMISG